MFFGFYSVVSSVHQQYLISAWAIVGAGIFDMLDGRVARLAKATSPFGVQYDSLSDLISFGIAPSLLAYVWVLESWRSFSWLLAFLFLACGALRLARFNVSHASVPKTYFQGLPITLAAQVLASFVIAGEALHWTFSSKIWILAVLLLLSLLMVSTLRFQSYKEVSWKFGFFWVFGFSLWILLRLEWGLFAMLGMYVVYNLLQNAYVSLGRRSFFCSKQEGNEISCK
jgi:CDP-diacylglycerol--serine O-phosphatidyltransferase